MPSFATEDEALAVIRALPGYIAGSLKKTSDALGDEEGAEGQRVEALFVTYAQEPPNGNGYKMRRAILARTYNTEDGETIAWAVTLPVLSETPEGQPVAVSGFGGPGEFYPYCFSMELVASRDGGDPVKANFTPWSEGDGGAPAFYRTTAYRVMDVEVGFQNIVACWARANEGDRVDFAVEAPVAFDGEGMPVAWAEVAVFGKGLQIFGTNSAGTYYPPNQSPNLSWIPAGCRMRLDYFRMAENDPWLSGGRGPFVELDFLCQRRREA